MGTHEEKNCGAGETYRCAYLDVVLPYGRAVVHCVEGGHFINSHWGHFKDARDFVHHTYAGEAVLSLSEVEKRHHSSFLVL